MRDWVERVAKVNTPSCHSHVHEIEEAFYLDTDSLRTVCCIYHAPKPIDESSDESSSDDSSSDDDSGNDDGSARPVGGRRGGRRHGHDDEDHDCGHDHGKGKRKGNRARSPNAYEKMPKVKENVNTRVP